MCHLVQTYGGIVIEKILQKRGRPSSKTYLGTGKAEEAAKLAKDLKVDMVIFNGFLRPHQTEQLGRLFSYNPNDPRPQARIPIWDRTDTILKIFEKHARSQVAKLQIQLAQLKHRIPKIYQYQARLFDRERGGISGTRGGGERGIEDEKRHIRQQIKELEKKLEQYKTVQRQQQERRRREGFKTVALVGYTNAGKSTLLRALTKKETYIRNELFSTLDTSIGTMWLPQVCHFDRLEGGIGDGGVEKSFNGTIERSLHSHHRPERVFESNGSVGMTKKKQYQNHHRILLADTIGFIQNLPPHLIESFQATLSEVQEADLILHVIDAADPHQGMKIKVVEDILSKLIDSSVPVIRVYNKSDAQRFCFLHQRDGITVSAVEKNNFDALKDKIAVGLFSLQKLQNNVT